MRGKTDAEILRELLAAVSVIKAVPNERIAAMRPNVRITIAAHLDDEKERYLGGLDEEDPGLPQQ